MCFNDPHMVEAPCLHHFRVFFRKKNAGYKVWTKADAANVAHAALYLAASSADDYHRCPNSEDPPKTIRTMRSDENGCPESYVFISQLLEL